MHLGWAAGMRDNQGDEKVLSNVLEPQPSFSHSRLEGGDGYTEVSPGCIHSPVFFISEYPTLLAHVRCPARSAARSARSGRAHDAHLRTTRLPPNGLSMSTPLANNPTYTHAPPHMQHAQTRRPLSQLTSMHTPCSRTHTWAWLAPNMTIRC